MIIERRVYQMVMKTISDFDTCFNYVVRLGIVSKYNTIYQYQSQLCQICDAMLQATGQNTWYHLEFKPFRIRYHRNLKRFTIVDYETGRVFQSLRLSEIR